MSLIAVTRERLACNTKIQEEPVWQVMQGRACLQASTDTLMWRHADLLAVKRASAVLQPPSSPCPLANAQWPCQKS